VHPLTPARPEELREPCVRQRAVVPTAHCHKSAESREKLPPGYNFSPEVDSGTKRSQKAFQQLQVFLTAVPFGENRRGL